MEVYKDESFKAQGWPFSQHFSNVGMMLYDVLRYV